MDTGDKWRWGYVEHGVQGEDDTGSVQPSGLGTLSCQLLGWTYGRGEEIDEGAVNYPKRLPYGVGGDPPTPAWSGRLGGWVAGFKDS